MRGDLSEGVIQRVTRVLGNGGLISVCVCVCVWGGGGGYKAEKYKI